MPLTGIHVDGLAWDYGGSSALALELLQSCAGPSMWCLCVGTRDSWSVVCDKLFRWKQEMFDFLDAFIIFCNLMTRTYYNIDEVWGAGRLIVVCVLKMILACWCARCNVLIMCLRSTSILEWILYEKHTKCTNDTWIRGARCNYDTCMRCAKF